MFLHNQLNWSEASEYCRKGRAHLATPTTRAKNEYLKRIIASFLEADKTGLLKHQQYWFGATAPSASQIRNRWTFVTGEKMTYIDWHPDQPTGDGKCVTYSPKLNSKAWIDIKWNDAACDHKFHFICEVSPKSSTGGKFRILCSSGFLAGITLKLF